MTNKEKAEHIDLFLKGLNDKKSSSSLANILESKQFPSDENKDKFELLEYELEKHDLVTFVRGRDNSTIGGQCEYLISGKGLDFVLKEKSTLELFDEDTEAEMTLNEKIDKLTNQAEKYKLETQDGFMGGSRANFHDNIALFTDWFVESRDLFSQYFDNSDINYSEFISFNTSGNGYTLSLKFLRLYPLYKLLVTKVLNNKILSASEKMKVFTNKGFIIHGHNDAIKYEVARFIDYDLKKKSIILHETVSKNKTVIEKFETNSDVDFAIALWTADDLGKAKKESDLKDRARQNVIFETGYFIGKLGREKVIILLESGVEKPSDYEGVVYISLSGNWKYELQKEINSIYE